MPGDVAEVLMERFHDGDITGMTAMFSRTGRVHHIPLGLMGLALEVGAPVWRRLFELLPGLVVETNQLWVARDDNHALLDVTLHGRGAFAEPARVLRQFHAVTASEDGLIEQLSSIWVPPRWFPAHGGSP